MADPQSFNRYSYVGNDPVNAVDPAGLFTVCVQQGVERSLDGGKTWFVVSSQNICFGGPGFAGTFDQALRTALGFIQNLEHIRIKGGTRAKFEGERLDYHKKELKRLLKLLRDPNSDCAKFLRNELGLSGTRVAQAVLGQRAYDGLRSTVDAGEIVWWGVGKTIADWFKESGTASAATASAPNFRTGGTKTDVYYGNNYSASTILHETLHYFLGVDDDQLRSRLGVSQQDRAIYGSLLSTGQKFDHVLPGFNVKA